LLWVQFQAFLGCMIQHKDYHAPLLDAFGVDTEATAQLLKEQQAATAGSDGVQPSQRQAHQQAAAASAGQEQPQQQQQQQQQQQAGASSSSSSSRGGVVLPGGTAVASTAPV
jgi:alanyl-tRNA synthetase